MIFSSKYMKNRENSWKIMKNHENSWKIMKCHYLEVTLMITAELHFSSHHYPEIPRRKSRAATNTNSPKRFESPEFFFEPQNTSCEFGNVQFAPVIHECSRLIFVQNRIHSGWPLRWNLWTVWQINIFCKNRFTIIPPDSERTRP